MTLTNKIAIVTGAGSGIGQSCAIELAREGATVIVTSLHASKCKETCAKITKIGGKSEAIKCDVSKKKEITAMVAKVIKKHKKIDILVNNAGVLIQKPITETTEKDWDFVLDVNLKGVFLTTQAVAKHMMKKKSGAIVSIASIAGKVGFPALSAYCASKGGIVNLTKEFAIELAPYGIRVNAIAPAAIRTAMTAGMLADRKQKAGLKAATPLGRIGEPEEIAHPTVFLCSEGASYITGQTLAVDGGWLAQ